MHQATSVDGCPVSCVNGENSPAVPTSGETPYSPPAAQRLWDMVQEEPNLGLESQQLCWFGSVHKDDSHRQQPGLITGDLIIDVSLLQGFGKHLVK